MTTPTDIESYEQGRLDEAEIAAKALVAALEAAAKVAERAAERVENAHVLECAALETALEISKTSGAARADYILRVISRLTGRGL